MATNPAPHTPLPDAPATDDPDNFDARADAFFGGLDTFGDQMDAIGDASYGNATEAGVKADLAQSWAVSTTTFAGSGSYKGARGYAVDAAASAADASDAAADAEDAAALAINAPGTSATSVTSLSVGTGTKSPVLAQNNKAFAVGQTVNLARTSAPATRMIGVITGFANPAGPSPTLTIDVQKAEGSGGPFTDWTIALSGPVALSPVPDIIVQNTTTTVSGSAAVLDATLRNSGGFGSIASATLTLQAGSYLIRGFANLSGIPNGGSGSASIYNSSDATTAAAGTTVNLGSADVQFAGMSFVTAFVTISSAKGFQLRFTGQAVLLGPICAQLEVTRL